MLLLLLSQTVFSSHNNIMSALLIISTLHTLAESYKVSK